MNLCFSTLGCTDRSLEEILSLAQQYNISFLEIRGIGGEMDLGKIEAFSKKAETNALFLEYGVVPRVLGTSCAFHDPAKYEDALREGRESIEIAKKFGIPYIRVFGNKLIGSGEDERQACIARVSEGIRTLCDAATGTSVTVLLEVHGDYNRVETLLPVVEALADHDRFGLIWDIAHTKSYGNGWDVFYQTFRKYIRHIHIKDYSFESTALVLPGEGDLPILPIVRALAEDGFEGCFSLEWEKKWHPELPEMELALSHFVSLMGQA